MALSRPVHRFESGRERHTWPFKPFRLLVGRPFLLADHYALLRRGLLLLAADVLIPALLTALSVFDLHVMCAFFAFLIGQCHAGCGEQTGGRENPQNYPHSAAPS